MPGCFVAYKNAAYFNLETNQTVASYFSSARNEALPGALHEKALDIYRQYLITGGMPQAVLEFVETKSGESFHPGAACEGEQKVSI